MMQVFVTGATGLVGSFVVKQLLKGDHTIKALRRPGNPLKMADEFAHDVQWIEGDLDDIALLTKEMEGCQAVVHAAALVSFDPADHDKLFQVNLEGTKNMLNAALAQQQKPIFCYVSSVAALAVKPGKTVLNETAFGDAETVYSPYGKSKFLAELELFRAEAEGLPVFAVNPSMVMGPGYAGQGSTALLSYATSRKFFTPTGLMNYVDVRDVAKLVVQFLAEPTTWGKRYIASAGNIPYPEFFAKVASLSGVKAPRYPVGLVLSGLGWRFSAMAALFTGKRPMLTKQSARAAMRRVTYKSENLPKVLPDFRFIPLAETLPWALLGIRNQV